MAPSQTEAEDAEPVNTSVGGPAIRYLKTKILMDEHGSEWDILDHGGVGNRYYLMLDQSRGKVACSVMHQFGWRLLEAFNPTGEPSVGLVFISPDAPQPRPPVDADALLDPLLD